MSAKEHIGCLTYKGKDGAINRLYPVTKRECLQDLEYVDEHLASTENPHKSTAKQVGAVAIEDVATVEETRAYIGL